MTLAESVSSLSLFFFFAMLFMVTVFEILSLSVSLTAAVLFFFFPSLFGCHWKQNTKQNILQDKSYGAQPSQSTTRAPGLYVLGALTRSEGGALALPSLFFFWVRGRLSLVGIEVYCVPFGLLRVLCFTCKGGQWVDSTVPKQLGVCTTM